MSETQATDTGRVAAVLARYPRHDPGDLVNILHDLQAEFRYLTETALQEAAAYLGLPPAQVYGVTTFYHGFHTEPRGEHTCTVCMGTACHVRGAPRLLEQLERDTGVAAGGTTPDLSLNVEEVSCVGACAIGPLVILDGDTHGHMTADDLSRLVTKLLDNEGRE
ncbi:MAG: NAD(P)H-dependent oxidoreductase subunit E [Actinobacteria bacterium]|nr:NAD(P)H-dependent oxidoreductase subunit E [Actinomycetota bacterium]